MSDGPDNSKAWMVTFSDLVMLLLTFFVLLLTMSSMDKKKLDDLFTHFKDATGVLEFSGLKKISDLGSFITHYRNTDSLVMVDHNQLLKIIMPEIELKKNLEELMTETIQIEDDSRGVVLSFDDDLMFDSGKATISNTVKPILDSVAKAIHGCNNDILIMGHTDNVPVNSQRFASNLELSAYRGLSVLDYFINEKKLSPSRFRVGGYGAAKPVKPNDTPQNRSRNRRVEIIFRHLQEV